MNVLKHLPPRPVAVRFRPPSKNSVERRECPAPSCLFAVGHGVWIVPELTVAQEMSLAPVVLQSAPWEEAMGVGFNPPLVKADTTSRSPSVWTPVKVAVPPLSVHPTFWSWRNQNATFASPVLALR